MLAARGLTQRFYLHGRPRVLFENLSFELARSGRLAILGRPLISGEMYGILTTLRARQGGQLQPVSTPLVLLPIARQTPRFGRIKPADPLYQTFREHLNRAIRDDYIRLIVP